MQYHFSITHTGKVGDKNWQKTTKSDKNGAYFLPCPTYNSPNPAAIPCEDGIYNYNGY